MGLLKKIPIIEIILVIFILASFVLVGTPIRYNCLSLNLSIIIFTGIIYVYKVFIQKENIKIRKIDILILMLCCSPVIPLIFNTYIDLFKTLISIVKNISLYAIYVLLKIAYKKNGNRAYNTIIDTLIIGGMILSLLGIDSLLSNTLFRYMRFIGIPAVYNLEHRMLSTLGYANSFAIIVGIFTFLAISRIKEGKVLYSGTLYTFLFCLILSYSRSVLLIYMLILILYFIFVKRKRRYIMYLMASNFVLALLGTKVFELCSNYKQIILAWLSVGFMAMTSILISLGIAKIYRKIYRIKLKIYIYIICATIVFLAIFFAVGKQLHRPLTIFENNKDDTLVHYEIYNIDDVKEYIVEFDVTSYAKEENNYTIEVLEENEYYDVINKHAFNIGNYNGKQIIKFELAENVGRLEINFKSKSKEMQDGLTINSIYINGKRLGINYLYLPAKLVSRIETFSFSNKSLWERTVFIKDGLKILMSNLLFGYGADGWRYKSIEVQNYAYTAAEAHSHIIQIGIENGIVSIICYMGIVIFVVCIILKRKRITEIELAFILLNCHSLIDFNMSFYIIMVIWVCLLSNIVLKNENNNSPPNKIGSKLIIPIILIVAVIMYINIPMVEAKEEKIFNNIDKNIGIGNTKEVFDLLLKLSNKEKYKAIVCNSLSSLDYKDVKEDQMKFVYDTLEDLEPEASITNTLNRINIMLRVLRTCNNEVVIEKVKCLAEEYKEEMLNNLNNTKSNRIEEKYMATYISLYNELFRMVK